MKSLFKIMPLIFLISACQSSNDESVSELVGTWVECEANVSTGSSKARYALTKDEFSYEVFEYSDENCTLPTGEVSYRAAGVYEIGNSLVTSSGLNAQELNLELRTENGAQVEVLGYDIFYISEANLYFGKFSSEHDGSSAAKRPIELDFENYYTRE